MEKLNMDCDLCSGKGLHEVLVLKSDRFSNLAPKKTKKARRVCWDCATRLFSKKLYNFGIGWRNIFFENGNFMDKYRYRYMVIHA